MKDIYEIKNVIWRKEKVRKEDEAWLIGHRVSASMPFKVGERAVFYNPAFPFKEHVTTKVKEIMSVKTTVIIVSTKAMYFLKKLPTPSNNFHD